MGETTRQKLAIDESRILLVTQNNRLVSASSEYINNITQCFKVRDGETNDLRNIAGLDREKFRRDYNRRVTNKYLYSTTKITRSTVIMAMGDYKVGYLIKSRSRYGDFIVVGRWYHENATESFLKYFVFGRAIFEQGAYFPKAMFIYKIKGITNITNQVVQKEDVYLPDLFF